VNPIPCEAHSLADPPLPPPETWTGAGSISFSQPSWQEMPTQYHIINALAALPVLEYKGATLTREYDNNDFHDQRILR